MSSVKNLNVRANAVAQERDPTAERHKQLHRNATLP